MAEKVKGMVTGCGRPADEIQCLGKPFPVVIGVACILSKPGHRDALGSSIFCPVTGQQDIQADKTVQSILVPRSTENAHGKEV